MDESSLEDPCFSNLEYGRFRFFDLSKSTLDGSVAGLLNDVIKVNNGQNAIKKRASLSTSRSNCCWAETSEGCGGEVEKE